MHPADAEIARENLRLSSENSEAPNEDLWTVVDEPLLTRGGCRIETQSSQIDASIETRLAEIAAQIMGSERSKIRDELLEDCPQTVNDITEDRQIDGSLTSDPSKEDSYNSEPEISSHDSVENSLEAEMNESESDTSHSEQDASDQEDEHEL